MFVYVYLKDLWHSAWFWKFCAREETSGLCTATDQKVMLIGRALHDEAFGMSPLFSRDEVRH